MATEQSRSLRVEGPHSTRTAAGAGASAGANRGAIGGARAGWRSWRGLLVVLAVAAAVRVALLLSLDRSLYASFLLWDERTYDAWARALVNGEPFRVYDQSSLPAFVMAAVYAIAGFEPTAVRAVHLVFGVATCGIAWGIGRELRGPAAGVLAGLALAVYRPFAFFSVTLLKESLALLLFAALVLLFLLCLRPVVRRRVALAVAFGAAAALTLNVRQNVVLVFPVMAAALIWSEWRGTHSARAALRVLGALAGGFLVVLPPFVAQTYRDTGQLSATPVGGFNLLLGNSPSSGVPFYRPLPFSATSPQEHAIHFTVEASRRVGRPLSGGEASSYWTREVLRRAGAQPGAFARHLGTKALAVLNRWEEYDNHDVDFLVDHVPALRLPFLTLGLVLPLGLAGLCWLAVRDRRAAALLVVAVAYALTLVAVWPNARYRAPLLLVLVPAAAAAALSVAARPLRWRSLGALASLTLLFTAIEWLPIPGAGDRTAALNTHAANLYSHGRFDEAREFWNRSADVRGAYSEFAVLGLARAELGRQDPAAARALLERVRDDGFAAGAKHVTSGDAWMYQGECAKAIEAYERSLHIDPAQRFVYSRLMEASERCAPERVDEVRARLASIEAFFTPR